MTGWKVLWKDHKGNHHSVSYSSMSAVLDHVGYCLKNGMTIDGVHKMHAGEYSRCIFKSVRQTNYENNRDNKKRILEVMKRDGSVIVTDLMNILDLPYRNEPMKRTSVRTMLYQLGDKGLIEPIEGSHPTRWKLKEESKDSITE